MKKLLSTVALTALLMPSLAVAQSDFDGSWKIDLNKTMMPDKPEVFLLQNGMYQCKTCAPVLRVKADGTDQSVTGSPYYDMLSVKVVDDRSVEKTEKKNGKTVFTSKMTVSPDGNTAVLEFTDGRDTDADPIVGKETMTRVLKSKRPAGSHVISGSWRISKLDSLSDNALVFTFKVEGDSLTMTTPGGQSYIAKLDGTEAPYKGDPGVTSVR